MQGHSKHGKIRTKSNVIECREEVVVAPMELMHQLALLITHRRYLLKWNLQPVGDAVVNRKKRV